MGFDILLSFTQNLEKLSLTPVCRMNLCGTQFVI